MNSSKMISKFMKSNMPQNMMKTFGIRKTKKRSMTLSLMGLVASAAAAYAFSNKKGRAGSFFQSKDISNGLKSAFPTPLAAGMTEFAKEFASEMSGMTKPERTAPTSEITSQRKPDSNLITSSASATSPESNELINQIGSVAKTTGDDHQLDGLATKLIQSNLNTH